MKTQMAQTQMEQVQKILKKYGIEEFEITHTETFPTLNTRPGLPDEAKIELSMIATLYFGHLPRRWKTPDELDLTQFETKPGDGAYQPSGKGNWTTAEDFYKSKPAMTKESYMKFHAECCEKMIAITKAKNSDYTGGSDDPFSNFAQIGALVQVPQVVEIGFLTRMSDKISRIGSFITKGSLQVKDESVEDTLLDLANYCILFAGYLRSKR